MINKTNLWFLTLTSIILVLAIYYIALPGEKTNMVFSGNNTTESEVISIEESEAITAMRITKEEDQLKEIKTLQEILLNDSKTVEEKNEAYEKIQNLNSNKSIEEKIENLIKTEFKLANFVQIKENTIKVVVASKKDDYKTANNIISLVNKELENNYYVTVKFE